jgi:integrase
VRGNVDEKVVNTLIRLRSSGLSEGTLRNLAFNLKHLAKFSNLDEPESVKDCISRKGCANSFKENLSKAYNYYAVANGLEWIKPKYRFERKLPRIPTTETLEKIISSASPRYATILRILMKTAVMPKELAELGLEDIDLERGIVKVHGLKGHNSRIFKLKPSTQAMIKAYLAKNNRKQPFPNSEWICKCYRQLRNKLADKLKDKSIRQIRLYDFRHYFATMLYYKTKDILLVKEKLGHKKLETSLIYTQLVDFNEDEEYFSSTARTVEEAKLLIEQGFEYITEMDGIKLFRKRK